MKTCHLRALVAVPLLAAGCREVRGQPKTSLQTGEPQPYRSRSSTTRSHTSPRGSAWYPSAYRTGLTQVISEKRAKSVSAE